MSVTGQDKVIKNLTREISAMKGRTRAGLTEAGLLVRRESMIGTPVESSNLKNAHYGPIVRTEADGSLSAEIGTGTRESLGGAGVNNSADYAVYVHENLEAHHKTGRARFLALALVENAKRILEIIKRSATIR